MDDVTAMRRALELAARGAGRVSPNPLVGAVVVTGGEIVGQGWHEGPGTPHAEVVAIDAAGDRARGGTLYVTLEPCAHTGRTPPCAPRVSAAGIVRVVAGIRDPNPLVDGRGFAELRARGVAVEEGVLADEAERQNEPFLTHVRTGRPLVVLKMAASMDGRVAARDGSSRWISGPAAREEVHRMRAAVDAVLVGAGTAAADDPLLTARVAPPPARPPLRVVVDGRGRVPSTHRVFGDEAPTLVATTEAASEERRAAWRARGADVVVLDGHGDVPLADLVDHLGKRDVQSVLIEGGPTLAWAAVESGIVDRLVVYFAPVLVGGAGAPGILQGEGVETIGEALRLRIEDVTRVGEDVKVVARVHGHR